MSNTAHPPVPRTSQHLAGTRTERFPEVDAMFHFMLVRIACQLDALQVPDSGSVKHYLPAFDQLCNELRDLKYQYIRVLERYGRECEAVASADLVDFAYEVVEAARPLAADETEFKLIQGHAEEIEQIRSGFIEHLSV